MTTENPMHNSSTSTPSGSRSISAASRPILNIPAGNSQITEIPSSSSEDDRLSGDKVKDWTTAISRIDVKHDLENIGQIPCARSSLLYGIGGGAGIGAIRFLGSERPKVAANWAVGSFIVISLFQWQICSRARAREMQTMRMIQDQFAHRHVSNLRRRAEDTDPAEQR